MRSFRSAASGYLEVSREIDRRYRGWKKGVSHSRLLLPETESDLTRNAIDGGSWECKVRELLEMIAKALVDNPDQVQVRAIEGEEVTVLELRVHPGDVGKVIGREGRMAKSIRIILGAAGMKLRKRVTVEIIE